MTSNLEVAVTRFGVHPGGTALTDAVAAWVSNQLSIISFGSRFDNLFLEIHFRHEGKTPRPFDSSDVDRYHEYIAKLPLVRVRPAKRRVEVLAAATGSILSYADVPWYDVDAVRAFIQEIYLSLNNVGTRLRRVSHFHGERILDALQRLNDYIPNDERLLKEMLEKARVDEVRKVHQQIADDPWTLLDVEWDQFHPSAREVLDSPFFWDPADEDAPHGNDAGADVLDSYRRFRREHSLDDAERFIRSSDFAMSEDQTLDGQLARDQSLIAAAFAQLMVDATVTPAIAALALTALDRQISDCDRWPNPGRRLANLDKLRRKLLQRISHQ